MEIIQQIVRDYNLIDYEYNTDYSLDLFQLSQLLQHTNKLRKNLKFPKNLDFSEAEREFESIFFTRNGVRAEISRFDALVAL